jgi:hypothetical protein
MSGFETRPFEGRDYGDENDYLPLPPQHCIYCEGAAEIVATPAKDGGTRKWFARCLSQFELCGRLREIAA